MRGERVPRLLADLERALAQAADLVERGRDAYDRDPALPLAFEALSNRVGDLAKRLVAIDPSRFHDPIWSNAARNRDFVAHHYSRIDPEVLWSTVSIAFPQLAEVVRAETHD